MYRNGAGSLISLTFDDGLPCQIKNALPELNKRFLPATFFVIAAAATEYDDNFQQQVWRDAQAQGHEVGSHSLTHCKAATLNPVTALNEAKASREFLGIKLYGMPVSYCYPYTDAPDFLQRAVGSSGYLQARGGRGARADKYLEPGDGANLLNVPCFHAGPETIQQADQWIAETVKRGAWLTLMFHAIGQPEGWDNIDIPFFVAFLDKLVAARALGLQTVTFAEGGKLYRAGRR